MTHAATQPRFLALDALRGVLALFVVLFHLPVNSHLRDLPLVMHGSSSVPQEFIDLVNKYGGAMPNAKGVPEDQISQAVRKYGVCKVNIDTDLRLAMTAKIREVFATNPKEFDPRNYLGPAREAITKMVQRKLHVLNSAGKAEACVKQWEKLGKPLPSYYTKGRAA